MIFREGLFSLSSEHSGEGRYGNYGVSSVKGEKEKKMIVPFAKYHGLGNDFILINEMDEDRERERERERYFSSEVIQKICDRHRGIGADGIIFLSRPSLSSCYSPNNSLGSSSNSNNREGERERASHRMKIFNSDGSSAKMCGNGIRCLVRFISDLEGTQREIMSYQIETDSGIISAQVSEYMSEMSSFCNRLTWKRILQLLLRNLNSFRGRNNHQITFNLHLFN